MDLTEEDRKRFDDYMCSMVGFNFEEHSIAYINEMIGCTAEEVDIPNGASLASPIFFRIKGLTKAINAILKVKENRFGVDVYFRQATDHYDKLRVVQIWGSHGDIKEADKPAWKRFLKQTLEERGEVLEIAIFQKGFIVVTFKFVAVAKSFEVPFRFKYEEHALVASYTTSALVIFPDDVVLDGFYAEDRKNILELALNLGGPIRRVHFSKLQFSKMMATFSFVHHRDAVKFASLEKVTLKRDGSSFGVTLIPRFSKDYNMRKEKKEDGPKATQDLSAFESRLIEFEKKLADEKKAGVAEFERVEKLRRQERASDHQAFLRVVTESQQRVAQAMAYVVSAMMDKQATINHIGIKITHCREDKLTVIHQIDKWEDDPTKADKVAELIEEKKVLVATISKLEDEMQKVLETKVDLPMLDAPSTNFDKLEYLDNAPGVLKFSG